MFLYWCTTDDGDEDWFIAASRSRVAVKAHEDMEGYNRGDASAERVCKIPGAAWDAYVERSRVFAEKHGEVRDGKFDPAVLNGSWPDAQLIKDCGGTFLTEGSPRVVAFSGDRIYTEGALQAEITRIWDDEFEARGEGRPNRTPTTTPEA